MPILKRIKDGAGSNGHIIQAISWHDNKTFRAVEGNTPIIGCSLLSHWLTTVVTEIIKEDYNTDGSLNYVKFKTLNSEYELYSDSYKITNKEN